MSEHVHRWVEVDITPSTSKRYVFRRWCPGCLQETDPYDGGKIPFRCRIAGWRVKRGWS